MVGFLGYHPDAVLALRRAVAAARAEADRARCDDPLAGDATERVRRASNLLAPWEARLAAVLDCAFATPYRRVAAGVELPVDYQRLVDPAWTVVTDPLAAPPPPLDAVARADELVALVLALDPSQLADAAFVERLDAVLAAVFTDVVAAARFYAGLGADGFAAVARTLAAIGAGDAGQAGSGAAVVLRRLALGFGAAIGRGDIDEVAYRHALLDGRRAEPHAAAVVLAEGGLPTAVLTTWALAIVQASGVTPPTAGAGAAAMAGHPTGAYVLEALTRDPAAGHEVLRAMLSDLDLLLGSHLPADARGRFLLATSDPGHFDASATVPTVVAVLDYLIEHPGVATSKLATAGDGQLRAWLGAYVGPYLLALSDTARQPGGGALAWVAEDPAAATSLQAWILRTADTGLEQVFRMPASPDREARLADVCRRLGLVVESLAGGRVAWAKRVHGRYAGLRDGLNLGLAQGLAELGDRVLPGSSLLTGPVAQRVVEGALDGASDQGWLTEPPTADTMRRLMDDHGDRLEARIMVAAVAAHYQSLRDGGTAPVGVPAPTPAKGTIGDDYRRELHAWAGTDPARRAIADTADSAQYAVSTGRRESDRLDATDEIPGVEVVPPPDTRFDDGSRVGGSPERSASS